MLSLEFKDILLISTLINPRKYQNMPPRGSEFLPIR
jgi:hypothetical protein